MNTMDYMMIPVRPGGRDHDGVDCWGIPVLIYREQLGIHLPLYLDVDWSKGESVVLNAIADAEATEWVEVAAQDRREYDVVILRIGGVPWHVGVVVDRNYFIHADPLRGVCKERFDALHWRNRVIGYRRLKGYDNAAVAPAA